MLEVTRRHIMRISALDLWCCCAALPALASRAVRANGAGLARLNFDAFVERLETAAKGQHRANWDQARYVQKIADLARRLNGQDTRLADAKAEYRNLHPFYPEFRDLLHTADVQISLISFERGESIPHHDHPDMTGVMTCAVGSVEVKEYDLVGGPARSGSLLKFSAQQRLEPGMVSTLTAQSKNVHAIRATAFSQVVDIFTPPYDADRTKRTRWFHLERIPGSGETFLAHSYRR